jgi:hypothetical protein
MLVFLPEGHLERETRSRDTAGVDVEYREGALFSPLLFGPLLQLNDQKCTREAHGVRRLEKKRSNTDP